MCPALGCGAGEGPAAPDVATCSAARTPTPRSRRPLGHGTVILIARRDKDRFRISYRATNIEWSACSRGETQRGFAKESMVSRVHESMTLMAAWLRSWRQRTGAAGATLPERIMLSWGWSYICLFTYHLSSLFFNPLSVLQLCLECLLLTCRWFSTGLFT